MTVEFGATAQCGRLVGTRASDTINRLSGNDVFFGRLSTDFRSGEFFVPMVSQDNDRIYGGAQADTITLSPGNDTIDGETGQDSLILSLKGIAHTWEPVDDPLRDDRVTAEANSGADALRGRAGKDLVLGGGDNDAMDGGAGRDTVDDGGAKRKVSVDLEAGVAAGRIVGPDPLPRIENATRARKADSLTGESGGYLLIGTEGADTLIGSGGKDSVDLNDIAGFGGIADMRAAAASRSGELHIPLTADPRLILENVNKGGLRVSQFDFA